MLNQQEFLNGSNCQLVTERNIYTHDDAMASFTSIHLAGDFSGQALYYNTQ
jgi:hypothetical protein